MTVIRFKQFTKPQILRSVRRPLLAEFFRRFETELAAAGLHVPDPAAPEEIYVQSLTALLLSPEKLPEALTEALFAIDEMSQPRAQERLEAAVDDAGLVIDDREHCSAAELALSVWLADASLLAAMHNQHRMVRLSAFAHFRGRSELNQQTLTPLPGAGRLSGFIATLDAWFARHGRGARSTRVAVYPIDGEYWFLIRHGHRFTRTPVVDQERTDVIHFRPEKDDVAVYSPEQDEIRINARTRGERELYRRQLGVLLRQDEDHFSEVQTYTLQPLRDQGLDALEAEDVVGISKVVLREVEVVMESGLGETTIVAADDLLRYGFANRTKESLPDCGRIRRAAFEFHFTDRVRPGRVEIRLPNVLKVGRACEARLVNRFIAARQFRVPPGRTRPECNR